MQKKFLLTYAGLLAVAVIGALFWSFHGSVSAGKDSDQFVARVLDGSFQAKHYCAPRKVQDAHYSAPKSSCGYAYDPITRQSRPCLTTTTTLIAPAKYQCRNCDEFTADPALMTPWFVARFDVVDGVDTIFLRVIPSPALVPPCRKPGGSWELSGNADKPHSRFQTAAVGVWCMLIADCWATCRNMPEWFEGTGCTLEYGDQKPTFRVMEETKPTRPVTPRVLREVPDRQSCCLIM
ncbi:MAG: hypothetical protein B7Y25_04525 [Alphaproteobacteria bacterium 16-39-46]|nr:MAG: hypothetical protein B7Y25_04525 [Alphaproteobacteria bacterium 16-39-46]OZA42485.1 MAG: hypothetical protein B7X84_05935 [Alphaproteobacteria bacterium 17-39-52]